MKSQTVDNSTPRKWVFIVACYNSGTTLLKDILANHPDIGDMPGEGQNNCDLFIVPKKVGLARLWALKKELFQNNTPDPALVKAQWYRHYNDPHRPVLLERSIPNAARIPWLQQHFAPAHFIALVRNGYAVAEGIHRRAGHDYALGARQWMQSNELMLDSLTRVPRVLHISYETLAEHPAAVLAAIADFIGVEDRFAAAIEHHQVYNHNAESLARLDPAARRKIEREALPMLRRFGYYGDGEKPSFLL